MRQAHHTSPQPFEREATKAAFGQRRLGLGYLGQRLMPGLALALAVGLSAPQWLRAQQPDNGQAPSEGAGNPGGGGRRAGMGRTGGEITAISGNTLTVKAENGHTAQIVTTDNTRVVEANGPVKFSELHVGDGLMAIGNLDPETHTLHAAMIMATGAAELKAMRDNLGKTYITGHVTAINLDDARMTVERPDHVAQSIGFDESTSFKRAVRPQRRGTGPEGEPGGEGRAGGGGMGMPGGGGMGMMAGGGAMVDRAFANAESITLADIKVGDSVAGTGTVKNGVFTPSRLLDSPPRPRRNGAGEGEPETPGTASQSAPAGPGAR